MKLLFPKRDLCCQFRNPVPVVNSFRHIRDDTNHKIVGIMGATGAGKSRLSIDLAAIFSGEIINSDKIQLYAGLDITTNKIPHSQRRGIRHHLLGEILSPECSAGDYRTLGAAAITDISSRGKLPILAGGSNSFIHALLARRFDSRTETPHCMELRYRCCFLWVDVSPPVLEAYLEMRVEEMLRSGMVEELKDFFDSEGVESGSRAGLRKAIGVPEFGRYFQKGMSEEDLYEEAVKEIKENTYRLARKQVERIGKLRDRGWEMRRIDLTEIFRRKLEAGGDGKDDDVWERDVVEPSVMVVKKFLEE